MRFFDCCISFGDCPGECEECELSLCEEAEDVNRCEC